MTVYYHALFLFTITKKEKIVISQEDSQDRGSIEVEEYIENIFSKRYVEFLLGLNEEKIRQLSVD